MSTANVVADICSAGQPALRAAIDYACGAARRLRVEDALKVLSRSPLSPAQSARLVARAFELQDELIRAGRIDLSAERAQPLLRHAALSLPARPPATIIVYALTGSGQLLEWRDYEPQSSVQNDSLRLRAMLRDVVCTAAARALVAIGAGEEGEPSTAAAQHWKNLPDAFAAVEVPLLGVFAVGGQRARNLGTGKVEWVGL